MFAAASALFQSPLALVRAPLGLIGIVTLVLCITRRNENIGGWLMFFYYQIYGSLALFLLSALSSAQQFLPSYWRDASDYLAFLGAVVPRYAAFALVGTVATVLLARRTHAGVIHLRITLGAALGLMMLPLLLDILYFQDALIWNFLRAVLLGAWLIYFFVSERVKRVFPATQSRGLTAQPSPPPFS